MAAFCPDYVLLDEGHKIGLEDPTQQVDKLTNLAFVLDLDNQDVRLIFSPRFCSSREH